MAYKDKSDQAKAAKRHYINNRQKIITRSKDWKDRQRIILRNLLIKIKMDSCCVDCGTKDHRILEFHHIKNKKIEVSLIVNRGWSIKSFMDEIYKCIVLCSNCHRIRHYEEKRNLRADVP